MTYRVEVEARARREFLALPPDVRHQLSAAIDSLQQDPRPPQAKRLVGRSGYRLRRGDYRVLYTVDDKARLVRVYRVGNRREVYRRL